MDAPPYEQVVIDAPSPLQHETFSTRPTSPMMSYHTNNITHTIPLGRLHMHIELHVATAFVDCSSTWLNTSNEGVILLFVFPLKGTVTGAAVRIGKGRMLETTYIPHEDADKFSKKNSKSDEANGALEAYTPGLFRLPIPRVAAGEQVCVRLTYLEPLRYREGAHHFTSLLDFPHNTVALGPIQNIVSINAIINCLLPGIEYTSDTHDLVCIRSEALRVELAAQFRSTECVSFKFSYSMPCDSVLAALIQQNAPPYSNDPRSSFLLFVSPPSHNMMDFPRDFVIVFG